MKFEIKSALSGSVLFSFESTSLKLTLEAAVKQGAYLQGAYLRGADLQGAYLRGADLRGANLRGAYLQGANLQGANLRGAYLQGANLQGANLRGANLRGADLRGAKNLEKFPIQIIGHKHAMWTTQDGELQIGCHTYTFDEWRELADKLGNKEGYDAIDIEIYKLHVEHLARVSQLLWNKKKD